MRLRKIKQINVGPFKNYSWDSSLPDFDPSVNILLGWNGSGKTIISRMFQSLNTGSLHQKINDAEFQIETDKSVISSRNIQVLSEHIRVFNEDYIQKIISQTHLDYVIALGEEEVDLSGKEKSKLEIEGQLKEIKTEDEHTTLAKSVALDIIKPIPGLGHINKEIEKTGRYDSYSTHSFERRIEWLENEIRGKKVKLEDYIQPEAKVESLRSELNNISLRNNDRSLLKKWNDWLVVAFDNGTTRIERINHTLQFEPVFQKSQRIASYGDNSPEELWIREGVKIHNLKNAEKTKEICLFCSSPLENKQELLRHFSNDLTKLKDELDSLAHDCEAALGDINSVELFYSDEKEKLNTLFEDLDKAITEKKAKVLSSPEGLSYSDQFPDSKNDKPDSLEKVAWTLETHYVAKNYKEYIRKKDSYDTAQVHKNALESKLKLVKSELIELRTKAKDVHIPKKHINDLLLIAFPYRKLNLEDTENGIGYCIERNGRPCNLMDLSEGERNFIALAYFLLSLNTQDGINNFAKDGVVIIDDPISSLDSDSLFHTFSILLGEILAQSERQYIILTHNLDFFGHLLKHFKKLEEESLDKFYQLRTSERGSYITTIDDKLANYNSDYRYAVSKLNELKDSEVLDDQIFSANLLRRSLETFVFFKYGFGDLRSKTDQLYAEYVGNSIETMEGASDDAKIRRRQELIGEKEVLYRFINYGSHQFLGVDKVDLAALSHSTEAITNFFKLVQNVDRAHYKSLKLQL